MHLYKCHAIIKKKNKYSLSIYPPKDTFIMVTLHLQIAFLSLSLNASVLFCFLFLTVLRYIGQVFGRILFKWDFLMFFS